MTAIMFKYWPIQYVEDPFRGEGRNIGVMICGNGQAVFRCLGDGDAENIDTVPFSHISKSPRENAWIFREWVEWFRKLALEPDALQHRFRRLEDDCMPFTVGKEGGLEAPEGETLERAADWLYGRLVRAPRVKAFDFQDALESFMSRSETMYADGFERDIEIEYTPQDAAPVKISVNYALLGGRKALFKALRFKGAREHLVKRANDLIFTFQQAVNHGFTPRKYCFALTDSPTKHNEDIVALIANCCTVIDITKSGSAKELERILKDGLNEG